MKGNKVIPVFFCSDHNYIVPTCVAVRSLLESSKDCFCNIYIIVDDSVVPTDYELLKQVIIGFDASIEFLQIGVQLDNGYECRGISKACYYRLAIPWLVPDIDKAVYCDGDIIFKESVGYLFDQEIGDSLIAGVHTPHYETEKFHTYSLSLPEGVNSKKYINSGILVINCQQHRLENTLKKYMAHVGKMYNYQDQDIINIVCNGRIKHLPLEFNYPSYLFNATERCPMIIHYSGPKPWEVFTNLWADWWGVYGRSPVYNSHFESKIYKKILIPDYSFKKIIKLFMRHIKNLIK